MNVVWVHRGGEEMASYRYRAALPASEIARINGFKTSVNGGDAEMVVFAKPMEADLQLAKDAKAQGCKIVVDLCDDHFSHPSIGVLYREMAKLADVVTAATNEMAERIHAATGQLPAVIPDPYEQPRMPPHAAGYRALWFGHKSNLGDLDRWRPLLNGWELSIVTGPNHPDPSFVKWGPQAMTEELALANVVLLPTRPGAEYKSPNRLLNAIRGGCFPICSNHPSYREFRQLVWVGDIRTGLHWAKAFQDDLNGLVAKAQDYIEARFSPKAIGAKWAELLGAI